jgi:6-pyruvoyltetrahydropterin/6-carboxytetrahydropterin synthase
VYELTVTLGFAAAHNLKNFRGPCEELHGHNWKVEVSVAGDRLDEAGMVLDFGVLKKTAREVLDQLDHKYLNNLAPFKHLSPSSELIAKFIWDSLAARLADAPARLVRVTAWESDTARVSYLGPAK